MRLPPEAAAATSVISMSGSASPSASESAPASTAAGGVALASMDSRTSVDASVAAPPPFCAIVVDGRVRRIDRPGAGGTVDSLVCCGTAGGEEACDRSERIEGMAMAQVVCLLSFVFCRLLLWKCLV